MCGERGRGSSVTEFLMLLAFAAGLAIGILIALREQAS
jgi:hypothetical protein